MSWIPLPSAQASINVLDPPTSFQQGVSDRCRGRREGAGARDQGSRLIYARAVTLPPPIPYPPHPVTLQHVQQTNNSRSRPHVQTESTLCASVCGMCSVPTPSPSCLPYSTASRVWPTTKPTSSLSWEHSTIGRFFAVCVIATPACRSSLAPLTLVGFRLGSRRAVSL